MANVKKISLRPSFLQNSQTSLQRRKTLTFAPQVNLTIVKIQQKTVSSLQRRSGMDIAMSKSLGMDTETSKSPSVDTVTARRGYNDALFLLHQILHQKVRNVENLRGKIHAFVLVYTWSFSIYIVHNSEELRLFSCHCCIQHIQYLLKLLNLIYYFIYILFYLVCYIQCSLVL